jgi:hypothetical protein
MYRDCRRVETVDPEYLGHLPELPFIGRELDHCGNPMIKLRIDRKRQAGKTVEKLLKTSGVG